MILEWVFLKLKLIVLMVSWLLFIFFFTKSSRQKWGEGNSTKCTPERVVKKDDDNTGDDGGNEQVKGTSDTAIVTFTTRTQYQTKQ